MDIEINEVQEIIKNLESSGELSIKEEKYLNVAKLCVQLAAERDAATLEYDYLNDQIEYWKNKSINITEQRNELAAENVGLKKFCKNAAFDADYEAELGMERGGFTDALNNIETPATDRIVAGIKVDGVEEWVSSRGGRWNGTTEEALKFAKQLREGADK